MANFFCTLILPDEVEHWPLITLREKEVKIGAKGVAHARYTVSRLPKWRCRDLFRRIMKMVDDP